jgi:hypothetical protein
LKKLVIESLNELHSFEKKKDPLNSLNIGYLSRIKTISIIYYKNETIYLISDINRNDIRWHDLTDDLNNMKRNVVNYAKNRNSANCEIFINYLDENDIMIDTSYVPSN